MLALRGMAVLLTTHHAVELTGMEDLSASQKSESPKLPHDILADTVSQAGVSLRMTWQSEDIL